PAGLDPASLPHPFSLDPLRSVALFVEDTAPPAEGLGVPAASCSSCDSSSRFSPWDGDLRGSCSTGTWPPPPAAAAVVTVAPVPAAAPASMGRSAGAAVVPASTAAEAATAAWSCEKAARSMDGGMRGCPSAPLPAAASAATSPMAALPLSCCCSPPAPAADDSAARCSCSWLACPSMETWGAGVGAEGCKNGRPSCCSGGGCCCCCCC
ncbi:unnamed protein product, partial [Ectocarpus sp. 12 AP-2014]